MKIKMSKVRYNFTGVTSNGVENSLKNTLENIDGVKKVNVDLKSNSVDVEYNPPANESLFKICIEETGLHINEKY